MAVSLDWAVLDSTPAWTPFLGKSYWLPQLLRYTIIILILILPDTLVRERRRVYLSERSERFVSH
jgi:hypothetical protein